MKRRALFAAGLAAGLIVSAGFAWKQATNLPVSMVADQLRDETGLTLVSQAPMALALLPRPRITIGKASLVDEAGRTIVAARDVQGTLSIGELLRGQLAVKSLRLTGAQLDFAPADSGIDTVSGSLDRLVVRLAGASRLATLLVTDGQIAFGDGARIEGVNAVLSLPAEDGGFTLGAKGTWRGEPVTIEATWPSPSAASGATSIDLRARDVKLTLDGTLTQGSERRLDGRIAFATPSAAGLATWMGTTGPFVGQMPALSLNGAITLTARSASLPAAVVTLGGDRLEGALAFRFDQVRPILSGTLAARTLDLDLLLPRPMLLRANGRWAESPFSWGAMSRADLDLRLSATKARAGTLALDQVALGLILRAGRLEVNVVRADLGGGSAKGRLAVAPAGTGGQELDLRGQAVIDGVDAATLLTPLFPSRPLTGTSQGNLTIEAMGGSMAAVVASANGRGTLNVRDGQLAGINLADVMKAADRLPPPVTLDWRGGRTAFERLAVPFAIRNGQIDITDGQVSAGPLRGTLAGAIRVPDHTLSLRAGIVNPASANRVPIMFDIAGDLGSLLVTPDMRGIIERVSPPRIAPIRYDGP